MTIFAKIRNINTQMIEWTYRTGVWKGELRNIHRKRTLYKRTRHSSPQKREIRRYFKHHFGREFSTRWHRLYESYTGKYRIDYFPEILFSTRLEPKTNPRMEATVLGDKNLLPMITALTRNTVRCPQTIFAKVRGTYVSEGRIIDVEQARKLLQKNKEAVLKKSIDSSSGRNIFFLTASDAILSSPQAFREFEEGIGEDYVAQEPIIQAESLATLYPHSLNTFRIVTYIVRDRIGVAPVSLRMGQGGSRVDNVHFGGMTVGVTAAGALRSHAYTEMGDRFSTHPDTGVTFANYQIEGFEYVTRAARTLHAALPWMKILSWDLTLDERGDPVLVEVNTTGQSVWFPQMVNGQSMFGTDTPYFLNLIA